MQAFYIIKNTTTVLPTFNYGDADNHLKHLASDLLTEPGPGSWGEKAAAPAQVFIITEPFAEVSSFPTRLLSLVSGLEDISTRENRESTWPINSFPGPCLSPRHSEDILAGGRRAWKRLDKN